MLIWDAEVIPLVRNQPSGGQVENRWLMNTEKHIAQTAAGEPIRPGDGVIPILKEIEPGKLALIGTGFYITRYGLFLTAGHVLKDICVERNEQNKVTRPSYVLHLSANAECHLRPIRRFSLMHPPDLAVGHAENYKDKVPECPLKNLRGVLSTKLLKRGARLVTYAYPENEILDFKKRDNIPEVVGDYFEGEVIEYVQKGPWMPYPHYRTSIDIRHGASGGPVFWEGQIVGVNCRGWDFEGAEHQDSPLSSVIPVEAALQLQVGNLQLPDRSWEHSQIPSYKRGEPLTIEELVRYGHIVLRRSA